MDIEAAELAVIARIKSETGAHAKGFPEDTEMYVPIAPVLEHLVRFQGTALADPTPNKAGVVVQDTRIEWLVVSAFRHLTGHAGAYAHLEALRAALTGYTIPSIVQASVLWPTRQEFLREVKGIWYWQSVFAMTALEQGI